MKHLHITRRRALRSLALSMTVLGLGTSSLWADCSLTETGNVPLPDLGSGLYQGLYEGGLYPGGVNVRPVALEEEAVRRGEAIEPLDAFGRTDRENGRIVMLSVGMSNTGAEIRELVDQVAADPAVNPRLVVVNTAWGGRKASSWLDPFGFGPDYAVQLLHGMGLTERQVQIVWVKNAEPWPHELGPFPTHAEILQQYFVQAAQALEIRFPNLQLMYFSSRTRAWLDEYETKHPEPFAYENGFAVKWVIEQQLGGDPALNADATAGEVVAPLLLWGPYLWADGTEPRSDGFVWECSDTRDGEYLHPSEEGSRKVAEQLLAFFKTDPSSRPWFLRAEVIGRAPQVLARGGRTAGSVPLFVRLVADADDADGAVVEYFWTFGDGTFSNQRRPRKVFMVPGKYEVQVTVTDDMGNTATASITVEATAG